MMFKNTSLLLFVIFGIAISAHAQKNSESKKNLTALKLSDTNEDLNQDNSLTAEVFITRTETQALQALERILAKKRGTAEEPELLFRLAELHMRRSKSGRFFDLYRDSQKSISFNYPEVKSESAIKSLATAIKYYLEIEARFPSYKNMDSALFNAAFASSQINLAPQAKSLYEKLISQHPKSQFVPDSLLSLGEIEFQAKSFDKALKYFNDIEPYRNSKVHSFGIYKAAWTLYNLRRSEEALAKLVQVFSLHDPTKPKSNLNLRSEALKDIVLFYSETKEAEQFQSYIDKIAQPSEADEAIILMAKLFDSHSRSEDLISLLSGFIKSRPLSAKRTSADVLLITTYETLKKRDLVLAQIKSASLACSNEECRKELANTTNELTKSWWDRWSKNKADKTYAELAEQAFELRLPNLTAKQKEPKTTFAYAEFSFQMGNFKRAQENYLIAFADPLIDSKIKHDSLYGAILSLNQLVEKNKSSAPESSLQIELITQYISQYPNGEFKTDLSFKLAELYYQSSKFDLARPILQELAQSKNEYQIKSQDLILDILNQQKNFKEIQSAAASFATNSSDEKRNVFLKQIKDQSNFAQLQENHKTASAEAAHKFFEFYKNSKNTELRSQALWKSITTYFASQYDLDGARAFLELEEISEKNRPEIKLLKDATEKSIGTFISVGFFPEAQRALNFKKKLGLEEVKDFDLQIEILALEKKPLEAFSLAQSKRGQIKDAEIARLLHSMLASAPADLFAKIEQELNSLKVEPYYTEIKVRKLEKLLKDKKFTEAFNESKVIVGQSEKAPREMRARARLVQAGVLEKEFIETKTSTTLDKLEWILSIKTEKMDKAQQAYLSALKLAETSDTKLKILSGLNRIYTNFIDTVGKPAIKGNVSLQTKEALFTELAKLVAPIETKRSELSVDLKNLAKNDSAVSQNGIEFSDLPSEAPAPTYIPQMDPSLLSEYRPQSSLKDAVCRIQTINDSQTLIAVGNICLKNNQAAVLQKILTQVSLPNSELAWVKFYSSSVSERLGQIEKSIFITERSIEVDSKNPTLQINLARLNWALDRPTLSHQSLAVAFSLGVKNSATLFSQLLVSYNRGDCAEFSQAYSLLKSTSAKDADQFSPALSECLAQSGQFDQALAAVQTKKLGHFSFGISCSWHASMKSIALTARKL